MRAGLLFELIFSFSEIFFRAQGNTETADYLRKVLIVKQGGGDVDAHLAKVADILLTDAPIDFGGLIDRINAEADELLARPDPSAPPDDQPVS